MGLTLVPDGNQLVRHWWDKTVQNATRDMRRYSVHKPQTISRLAYAAGVVVVHAKDLAECNMLGSNYSASFITNSLFASIPDDDPQKPEKSNKWPKPEPTMRDSPPWTLNSRYGRRAASRCVTTWQMRINIKRTRKIVVRARKGKGPDCLVNAVNLSRSVGLAGGARNAIEKS